CTPKSGLLMQPVLACGEASLWPYPVGQTSGTPCGRGGNGRRAALRALWAQPVEVRFLSTAPLLPSTELTKPHRHFWLDIPRQQASSASRAAPVVAGRKRQTATFLVRWFPLPYRGPSRWTLLTRRLGKPCRTPQARSSCATKRAAFTPISCAPSRQHSTKARHPKSAISCCRCTP